MYQDVLTPPWENSPLIYWQGLTEKRKESPKRFMTPAFLHLQHGLLQEVTVYCLCGA